MYNDSAYGLFQGSLFMQRRALNGLPLSGFVPVGDADKLELSPTQKFDDIEESQSGLRMTAAHIPTGTSLKVKANLLFASKSNLTKALWGTDTGAVAAGSVAAEIQTAYNNAMVPLANLGVSAVVVKLAGTATNVASIAVTAGGAGYTANAQLPLTLTTGVGNTAYAVTNAAGVITGVVVSGVGTTLATGATVTTPGAGAGAAFLINAGQAPLVLGTDYTVDAANGSLTILPTSTLVPAYSDIYQVGGTLGGQTQITVAYSYAAYTGKVEAFTTGIQYFAMRLQGVNVANNNQPVIMNVYQAALDMAKLLSMIEAKHNNVELDGMLLQDTTKPLASALSPFSQFFNIVKA